MQRRQFLALTVPAPLVLAGVRFAGPGPAALAQEEATPVPGSATVFVREHLELGPYLTDPDGMTLYLFTKDTEAGASVCNGDCAVAWPPFTAEEPLSLPQMVEGEVTVDLEEMAITPSTTVFTVGETYTFVATNVGEFPHEMLIEAAGERRGVPLVDDTGREAAIERLDAGATGTLEWTFTEPATLQLACHVRDHYAMGMVISITVVA